MGVWVRLGDRHRRRPLTRFAAGLGATRFEFGVLTSLPYLGALLSIIGAMLVERHGRRRLIFLLGLYSSRLLWFPIAIVPLWMLYRGMPESWAMGTFLFLVFVTNATGAVGGVPWSSWMADLVPARVRGKYFSRRRQWALLSAIPTAVLAGWVLDWRSGFLGHMSTMNLCAMLFICSAVFGIADIATFHWVPDIYKPPRPGRD